MYYQELPHQHTEGNSVSFLRGELRKEEEFQTVAELFAQLGDPARIRIFWLLCHCEECVINIAAMMDMSSPAVSHHLKSLRSNGLLVSRRSGKEVFYRAADTETGRLLHHMIEQVMSIACPKTHVHRSDYREDQIEVIRDVHTYLVEHLNERISIEMLSRRFHMNPTTLKAVFKSVYGNSLAAHIKEHRMEAAADRLKNSDDPIQTIAREIGYDSPSRFTEAFRTAYGVSPSEYRKSE